MATFIEVHKNYDYCDRRSIVSITDYGKNYFANNVSPKKVAKYHIDTTTAPPKKCDFALYIFDDQNKANNDDRVIFIELKGSNISHAIEQISQSIYDLIIIPKIKCTFIDARIVSSKCPAPRYFSTKEVALKKILKPHSGSGLIVSSNRHFTETI